MSLILSCLVDDPARVRRILDQLDDVGWPPDRITVLHPGEALPTVPDPGQPEIAPQAAVVGGGSGAVAAGAFGWLIGYGVLALPAAVIGAAIGTAAGAAIGAGGDEDAALRETLIADYRPHVTGDRAAILVQAQDARGHDLITRIFRDEGIQDIHVSGKGRMEPGTTVGARGSGA